MHLEFFLIFYIKKCGGHLLPDIFTVFKILQFIQKVVTFLSITQPFTFTFLSLKTKNIPQRPFRVYLERNALKLSYWGILSSSCKNIDFPGLREMTYAPPNLCIILVKFSSKYITYTEQKLLEQKDYTKVFFFRLFIFTTYSKRWGWSQMSLYLNSYWVGMSL